MRFWIVCLTPLALVAAAAAQEPRPSALADIYRCAEVPDAAARLSCFDAAVASLRNAEAIGQVLAVDRTQVETLERESFGFQLPSLSAFLPHHDDQAGSLERVESQVARVVRLPNGRHSFVLTNGQTWTQTEIRSATNVRVGDSIAIRRAALGGFMLSPEHGAAYRVRRDE